jgi:hypothetical protein
MPHDARDIVIAADNVVSLVVQADLASRAARGPRILWKTKHRCDAESLVTVDSDGSMTLQANHDVPTRARREETVWNSEMTRFSRKGLLDQSFVKPGCLIILVVPRIRRANALFLDRLPDNESVGSPRRSVISHLLR